MLAKKINNIILFFAFTTTLANAHSFVKYHDLPASEVPKHMFLKLQEGLKGESWKNFADHPAFEVLDIQVKNPRAKLNVFQRIEHGNLYRGLEKGMAQFYRYRNQSRLKGNDRARLSDFLFEAQEEDQGELSSMAMGEKLRSHVIHQLQWKLAPFMPITACLSGYYKNLFLR